MTRCESGNPNCSGDTFRDRHMPWPSGLLIATNTEWHHKSPNILIRTLPHTYHTEYKRLMAMTHVPEIGAWNAYQNGMNALLETDTRELGKIACHTHQKPVRVFWYQCLAPISGKSVMGITEHVLVQHGLVKLRWFSVFFSSNILILLTEHSTFFSLNLVDAFEI